MRRALVLSAALLTGLMGGEVFAQSDCDATIDLANQSPSETELRKQVADAIACEWTKPQKDYRALARLTDQYIRQSRGPACEILLVNARSKLELARGMEERGELSRAELDEIVLQRGRAWDVLTSISAGWERSGDLGVARDRVDEAFERCVLPARSELRQYPSVTITMEPETITGYGIYWDRVQRTESLPRILPGEHILEVHPPAGHRTSIRRSTPSGEETILACDHVGKVSRWLKVGWAERPQFTVTFLPADSPADTCTPVCAEPPCRDDSEVRLDTDGEGIDFMFWGGLTATAAGSIGVVASLVRASSLEGEGDTLFVDSGCAAGAASCRRAEVLNKYDSSDRWRLWGPVGFGIVAGAGVAAMIYSVVDDEPPEQGARLTPLVGKNHAGLWLSGEF